MPIDPEQVQAIFLAALECDEMADRAIVLARECGHDAQLRERVEALLKAHDDPSELPLPLAQLHATCDYSLVYAPGTVIAERYRLLEEIAEGGMGTVWMAQQFEPVHRRVALKLIKPGMDSRGVLSRFDAERQALALMEHPNVAKVFDGGLTDEGRPFFVMEYVQGLPITEYCDRARLSIDERLAVFIQVCRAMHHAHQKGIIHRDLKPSNVLVSREGGQAVPKVIDFGLAKATHEPLTEDTLSAAHQLIMGTLKYMSPEQAEHNNLDIDIRSDVYSLGVILYELLTGATPLESVLSKQAPLPEILRRIKEEEPSLPSSRLAGGDSLPSVAAVRSAEPAQLARAVRGDLDWIVMKSLEKERSRRYESANDLALDVDRYLRDEAIVARPPSMIYYLQKLARRHRLALVAAALVSATLLLGTIVSTALAIHAMRAMRSAEAARALEALHRRDAERQRIDAEKARAAESVQRKIAQDERNEADRRRVQAEMNFRNARNAIDAHFASLRENKLLNVPALQSLRTELLASALAYYRKFIDQHGDDPALEAERAHAYHRIGELTRAMGSSEQTIEALQQAIQRYEQLGHGHFAHWLAGAYTTLGRTQLETGRFAAAETSYRRALDIRQELAREAPTDRECWASVAGSYSRLGNLQTKVEKFVAAERSFRRALEICERFASEAPSESGYLVIVAGVHYQLAQLQYVTGRLDDAKATLRRAARIYEQLRREIGSSASYLQGIANVSYRLGHVHRIAGNFDAARASYTRALEMYERLSGQDASNGFYRRSIGGAHFHLGQFQSIAGQKDEAIRSWTTAMAQFRAATELGVESTGFHSSQAAALAMLGRWREAADVLSQTLNTADYHWRPRCQIALLRWAGGDETGYRAACNDLLSRRGSPAAAAEAESIAMTCLIGDDAVDNWSDVLAITQQAAAADPSNPVSLTLVGAAQYRAGQTGEAFRTLERSLPLHDAAESSASPLLDPVRASRVLCETMLMLIYHERNDQDALARQLQRVQSLSDRMTAKAPVYCDEGENWRIAFTVLFAERELARLLVPAGR